MRNDSIFNHPFKLVFIIIGGLWLLSGGMCMSPEQRAERERQEAAAAAEERRKGFHCLSSFDGNHNGLERLVRGRLNDPNSLETVRTLISPVNDANKHRVRMEFTATNAFGGRVRNIAIGLIDNNTCVATLLSVG